MEKNIKRVLKIHSLAPMYLVQDEKTGLYGVQLSNGRIHLEPIYQLDEDYDFSKNYNMVNISSEGKIFLVEMSGEVVKK